MLQFCISQQSNETPFIFPSTGISVYSFEEAVYHVFHYWRESADNFLSEAMITWVSELGLSFIASKMKEIVKEKSFSTRILDFLQLIEYFEPSELANLHSTLKTWEQRREWEQLKERADFLVERGEPSKALPFYRQALQLEENATLLNNIGVASMQLSAPNDALHYLTRAHALDPHNISIMLHYTEAAILSKQFEDAIKMLKNINIDCADTLFLHGLLACEQQDYTTALTFYEQAIKLDPTTTHYVYKMVDVYIAIHQYDMALNTLLHVKKTDTNYYVKEAEIHAAAGNIKASLSCMHKVTNDTNNAIMWAKLAEYYRQDNDLPNAEKAISQAQKLAHGMENDKIRLERARIKKSIGRTREHQAELTELLNRFKERYRADRL